MTCSMEYTDPTIPTVKCEAPNERMWEYSSGNTKPTANKSLKIHTFSIVDQTLCTPTINDIM